MTLEVLCLGETMAMVTPAEPKPLEDAGSLRLDVGGAESTVALYLADLGHRSAWASRVGNDPFGRRIVTWLTRHGVDVDHVCFDDEAPTGVYFKDPGAEATRVLYYRAGSAASRLSRSDLAGLPVDEVPLLHLTGITPALSPTCLDLTEAVLRRAEQVSFDVNYRPGLWPVAKAAPVLLGLARRADLVFVGLDEAQTLWGTRTPRAVRDLIDVPRLVVKDGAVGATEFEGGREVFVPAPPVEVVEPVGAGDAFAAGYLSGLLRGAGSAERLGRGHAVAGRALGSMGDFVAGGPL
ncbi:sugar kinase [Streptomyces sp. NPDC001508]|uniref:sugar kinase n=1 Tax=Streptomyces sp. NPDC001508 TaxID=3154656 RepID=UPI0033236C9D